MERINETANCFLKRTKLTNLQADKEKNEKIQIAKIKNESGAITTILTEKTLRNIMNSCMLTNQITQVKWENSQNHK